MGPFSPYYSHLHSLSPYMHEGGHLELGHFASGSAILGNDGGGDESYTRSESTCH